MENTPEKKERRLLSETEKKEIIELKMTGLGSKAIAAKLQLSPNSVKTFIHRHGKDPAYMLPFIAVGIPSSFSPAAIRFGPEPSRYSL